MFGIGIGAPAAAEAAPPDPAMPGVVLTSEPKVTDAGPVEPVPDVVEAEQPATSCTETAAMAANAVIQRVRLCRRQKVAQDKENTSLVGRP
jgi:hypothetical protein